MEKKIAKVAIIFDKEDGIIKETEKAYLIQPLYKFGFEGRAWIPKSCVEFVQHKESGIQGIMVPYWFIKKNGIPNKGYAGNAYCTFCHYVGEDDSDFEVIERG